MRVWRGLTQPLGTPPACSKASHKFIKPSDAYRAADRSLKALVKSVQAPFLQIRFMTTPVEKLAAARFGEKSGILFGDILVTLDPTNRVNYDLAEVPEIVARCVESHSSSSGRGTWKPVEELCYSNPNGKLEHLLVYEVPECPHLGIRIRIAETEEHSSPRVRSKAFQNAQEILVWADTLLRSFDKTLQNLSPQRRQEFTDRMLPVLKQGIEKYLLQNGYETFAKVPPGEKTILENKARDSLASELLSELKKNSNRLTINTPATSSRNA